MILSKNVHGIILLMLKSVWLLCLHVVSMQGMCDLLSVDSSFLILDLILAFWLDSCDCRALIATRSTRNFSEDAVVSSGPLLCLALLAS